jgi:hypothetical protein
MASMMRCPMTIKGPALAPFFNDSETTITKTGPRLLKAQRKKTVRSKLPDQTKTFILWLFF